MGIGQKYECNTSDISIVAYLLLAIKLLWKSGRSSPNDVLCPTLYGANQLSDQKFYALNETNDTPIYFSQYLTTGNDGSVMTQTMFGRVYVCNNDAHGYIVSIVLI